MAQTSTKNEADQLREDLDALRGDINTIMKRLKDIGETATAEAKANMNATGAKLRDDIGKATDAARLQGQASIDTLERSVRERPFVSIAMAFGLGMLIARFVGQRER